MAKIQHVKGTLASALPAGICGPNFPEPEAYIKSYLKGELPSSEKGTVNKEMSWHFVLQKHGSDKKKKGTKRKTNLTRRERRQASLLRLPRDGWDHGRLEGLREAWRSYMRDNLDGVAKAPGNADPENAAFGVVLAKSELVGSQVEVVRSRTPSVVGRQGTVVLETAGTLQVVTPDNKLIILPKSQSAFCIELDNIRFTIFGKHLHIRPSERSSKKIKTLMHPDL